MVQSCVGLKCQGSVVPALAFQVVGNRQFAWIWNSSISDNIRPYAMINYAIVSGYFPKAYATIESNSTFWQRPALVTFDHLNILLRCSKIHRGKHFAKSQSASFYLKKILLPINSRNIEFSGI